MKRPGHVLALAAGLAAATGPALAQPAQPTGTPKAAAGDGDGDRPGELEKQNLSGRAQGTSKDENLFERDRFFVDKTDSETTEKGTLIQGSITSTTFGYTESGGEFAAVGNPTVTARAASQFNRIFTDLRLQTDFRHIAAGRWDARVDVRGRMVGQPGNAGDFVPQTQNSVQSGLLGDNELEIKELWLVRNGVRSDIFVGRQFIPDLGGVKIDGLRVDYASSRRFTLLGFAGLYPIRGSRSIDTDYAPLLDDPVLAPPDPAMPPRTDRAAAGRFTGAGGFGAAYRTADLYGSFGGVALVPLSAESPRVFVTSNGYWRYGAKLDFYHLAVVDLVGSNAVNTGLTNLSLGLNYKPDQRLRGTLSVHRVDTETLNVQAQAFLKNPDPNVNVVQNEAYLQRIATNQARGSLSAGLGSQQRFELTAALAYRYRGEVVLTAPQQAPPAGGGAPADPATTTLPAAQSVEVYGALTDRRSLLGLRLSLDAARIFGVGDATFHHTSSTTLRASAGREIGSGRGEWDLELAYTATDDDNAGGTCTDITTCYGASRANILSIGGNLYIRVTRDLFAFGSAYVNQTTIDAVGMATAEALPQTTVTGLTGFVRLAYRF